MGSPPSLNPLPAQQGSSRSLCSFLRKRASLQLQAGSKNDRAAFSAILVC